MTPPCLWWVSQWQPQREIVEIRIWGEAHTGRAKKELADAQLSISALPCFRTWAVGDKGTVVGSLGAEGQGTAEGTANFAHDCRAPLPASDVIVQQPSVS